VDYVVLTFDATRTYHLKVFLVVDSKLLLVVRKQVLRSFGEVQIDEKIKEWIKSRIQAGSVVKVKFALYTVLYADDESVTEICKFTSDALNLTNS
jgi:hypothetical protein